MNFLKEAQSAFDFATYCPLLYKAIADNDACVPGYTYEEIIKISFLSHQHRVHLLDFLLTKISNLGWSGKQKVVRILLQLSQKGHYEVRGLLRRRDGELRKAASQGGPPDPVLANTPQLFFNSSIQELLAYIFDQAVIKKDEEMMKREREDSAPPSMAGSSGGGYGASSSPRGKYDGFGNTTFAKQDSIVEQVRDMVVKAVTPDCRRGDGLEGLLKADKGNYQPLSLPHSLHAPPSPSPSLTSSSSLLLVSSAGPPSILSPRGKAHVAGRVGGGWDSDGDEREETPPRPMPGGADPPLAVTSLQAGDEEEFVAALLEAFPTWPVDLSGFVALGKGCTTCNPFQLVGGLGKRMGAICDQLASGSSEGLEGRAEAEHRLRVLLLFVEVGLNEDLLSVSLLQTHLEGVLGRVEGAEGVGGRERTKARKVGLILRALASSSG